MNSKETLRFLKFELTGSWALITGGAGLLGNEHARALLQAGANVVLWDLNQETLMTSVKELKREYPSRQIISGNVDITNETMVEEAQEAMSLQGIVISILINNAAINPKYTSESTGQSFSRVENFSISDWDFQLKVSLTGAFICSKIFGTLMAKNRRGIILNIASDLSVISPDQRLYEIKGIEKDLQPVKPITYSVIKSGLIGMTQYLATYWRNDGVRVNALSPGGVYENQSDDFVQRLSQLIPLGRMAHADEYRSAVQFLCSDASSYMTGQNLIIDGGRTTW